MNISELGKKRSEKTRIAILDAAEVVFAEHGFDGARIDAIAEVSGHNKTLIFRYFGNKLGLYAEVLKRIDKQMVEPLSQLIGPLLEDETIFSDIHKLREFFKSALGIFFDYMVAHPRVMRMTIWEHADCWQTYSKLASLFEVEGIERLEIFFSKGRAAGLFRPGIILP